MCANTCKCVCARTRARTHVSVCVCEGESVRTQAMCGHGHRHVHEQQRSAEPCPCLYTCPHARLHALAACMPLRMTACMLCTDARAHAYTHLCTHHIFYATCQCPVSTGAQHFLLFSPQVLKSPQMSVPRKTAHSFPVTGA